MRAEAADPRAVTAHLRDLAELATRERVTVAHLVERLGPSSFAVVCLVLTVPFLQPVPTGPLATVCGVAFAALGRQMMRDDVAIRLPQRVRDIDLGPRTWAAIHRVVGWFVATGGRLGPRRFPVWTAGERGHWWAGLLVAAGGLLIAVPFFGVPLNNTLPALVVACAALARIHRDALFLAFAAFWLNVTLVYFGLVLWGVWFVGGKGLEWVLG